MQVDTPVNGEVSCQYEWRSSTSFSDTQVHESTPFKELLYY